MTTSLQFNFNKSQEAVYNQLIGELHTTHPTIDINTEKALKTIFSTKHENFSVLSKDIENTFKGDWALKDEVKQLAEKLFKVEHFKWKIAGAQSHNSKQANAVATVYKQFLDHHIDLKQLQKNVSQIANVEKKIITEASNFIEDAVVKEIKNKSDEFRFALGGKNFQNSAQTTAMTELYTSYLKGEVTINQLYTKIDRARVDPTIKENSKAILKGLLSFSEIKELKAYEKLQAFRSAVGGEQFLHSQTSNKLVETYENYINKSITLGQLHKALDEATKTIDAKNAAAAKEVVFRSDLGGDNYYNSLSTIQFTSLYGSYLRREINIEQLFYEIDEQAVHPTVKEASKEHIRATLSSSEQNLLKNYDKVQSFRSAVGGADHLHGPLTNNVTNLYKDYVDKKINLKTLYASMNTLAGDQALRFMEHIFKVDIGGDKYAETRSTQTLAKLFTSYLKGDTELEDLFYSIDDPATKASGLVKQNVKNYIKEFLSYGDSLLLNDYERVEAFRKAVGGDTHAYGQMTSKLANAYKDYIKGDITQVQLGTSMRTMSGVDSDPKKKALEFIDSLATKPTAATSSKLSRSVESELKSRAKDYESLLAKKHSGKPYTLIEAKKYLEYVELYYLNLAINPQEYNSKEIKQIEKDRKEVQNYFRDTRQGGGYNEIEQAARRVVLLTAAKSMDATFLASSLTKELCNALRELANPIITNIDEKKNAHPSITNHQRDIYTPEDLKILEFTAKAMNSKVAQADEKNKQLLGTTKALIDTLDKQVKDAQASIVEYLRHENLQPIHLEAILTKPVNELDVKDLALVVKAQHAFLEIQKNQGSTLDIALLPLLDDLRKVSQLRGENIDMAKLQWTIDEHDKAINHPRVAIEGGGPIGLLLGITQFEAGAKVSLYEKRSTQYDRTQVVKLDPKWMNTLQFYLGEEYYRLFSDPEHRGVIRPDGFGEIATMFLEEAIHTRLTHLLSMLPAEGDDIPFERLAAYELAEVQKPTVPGGKYTVAANYQPMADPAGKTPGIADATPKTVTREIDMLLCAGGKSSPMKQRFMPSSSAVTQDDFYGVCSWLAKDIPHQDKEKMDLFQDFRNMAHLNAGFFADYKDQLHAEFNSGNAKSVTAKDTSRSAIAEYIEDSFGKLQATDRTHVQTRTFENRGLIYIGMELPNEFRSFLDGMDKALGAKGVSTPEIAAAKKQMQKLWFQNIMHSYGLDKPPSNLGIDKIDTKFAATFPVDQYRIDPEHLFSEIKTPTSELLVAAAGDAFSSPHFMRYSGLTGGRENLFHLQDYTKGISHKGDKTELLDTLQVKSERTAKFVISRGAQFLEQLGDTEIDNNRLKSVIASLDKRIKETAGNPDFQLEKNAQGEYLLHDNAKGKTHHITPKPGHVEIDGEKFDSIDQVILQL